MDKLKHNKFNFELEEKAEKGDFGIEFRIRFQTYLAIFGFWFFPIANKTTLQVHFSFP